MVGRNIADLYEKTDHTYDPASAPVLEVRGLSRTGSAQDATQIVLHDVSFSVRAGEIVGLAGLVGGWTNFQLQHLVGVLLALLAAWLVWSAQLERSEKVYAALSILLPLWQLLGASMVRYLVVVFPVFEAAGARLEGRPYLLFAGLLALLQLVMFALFVASHPAVA